MAYWRVWRCEDGHLFESPFLPFASLKAIRTPMGRRMRCPVDKHVRRVDLLITGDLSPQQLAEAHQHRTSPIP